MAIGLATLISCESDSDTTPPPSDYDGVLLTKTIDTFDDGSTLTSEFTYNGNKLVMVEDSDGESDTYTYTGELLTKIEETIYDADDVLVTDVITFEYDEQDRLIKLTTVFGGEGNTQYEDFIYNSDGTITEKSYNNGNPSGQFTLNNELTLTIVNGNPIKQENILENSVYEIAYDDKNGPGKNMHQIDVLVLAGYYATPNNEISSTQISGANMGDYDETTTYTYNPNNYPLTSSNIYGAGTLYEETQTTEYFYNQ